jgi:hypothetical protein
MFSELKKFSRPTLGLICVFGVVLVGQILPLLSPILWPGGIGIGKDNSVSTKTIEKDKQGKTVKTIETIKYDDGKTLWDWGSLLGVPLSLAILGYVLQQQQQKRAEKLSKEQQERAEKLSKDQRRIADNETKEEVLQTYFDRLSVLLIDRNLIVLSNKSDSHAIHPEEKELLDSALDVIRARTLSILRRFENDAERITSVINFLIETEIVGKSKLNLSGANLYGANLYGANLYGANLSRANLSRANLEGANLYGANLEGAKLSGSYMGLADHKLSELQRIGLQIGGLRRANLQMANLYGAYLSMAYLPGANLERANLERAYLPEAYLLGANLLGANLREADLREANLEGANLEFAFLQWADLKDIKWNSKTVWPHKNAFTDAKNIPEELKKELGISP